MPNFAAGTTNLILATDLHRLKRMRKLLFKKRIF